ncbi:MAG: ATP-binding cassette domain-containing protein [Bacteroidales bacterium]|jgi:ABC-2 type transport system ATP-binding protein|nr:ATP-binding cassette domain-containing protein [Bacteroidales bacterium]
MLLQANNITKNYAAHRALDNVSISVKEGSIFGLLGPNGAGKTTLIRIINQITGSDVGEVLLNGEPLQQKHVYQIGYLPEERGLYKKMKVGEQSIYLAQLKGLSKRDAEKRLKFWFDKFEISAWWNKKVEELSKGMQQKIQFITTVLHEPKLLIFDEPFSGFDPINTQLLKNEILHLKEKGSTVIFSTHNMSSVEEICDDIALINKSRKVLDGSVSDIRRSFSSHIYEVILQSSESPVDAIRVNLQGRETSAIAIDTNILESEKLERKDMWRIRLQEPNLNSNALLQTLMQYGSIESFREMLPSMNDIFIQTVKSDSANEE